MCESLSISDVLDLLAGVKSSDMLAMCCVGSAVRVVLCEWRLEVAVRCEMTRVAT